MGSVSHWQADTAGEPFAAQRLRGTAVADIAIIGAGITGVAAALWLARAGARVAVVEARQIAAGASGRNGGFLLGGTAEPYAEAIARYGHERALRVWAYSVANHTVAARLVAEVEALGWSCGYQQRGSLRIATSATELGMIQASAAALRADGWAAEDVGREALPARLPATYLGGSFHPDDGEIQPARFVRGLALLAQRAGAAFYQESPVVALAEEGDGVLVTTAEGTLRAGALLLAANAWLPELGALLGARWLAQCVAPQRGQVVVTEPVAARFFPCPCYADEGYQYWRQLDDGRLVVGGWRNTSFATEAAADETPAAPVQERLDAFVHQALGLPETHIELRWAGVMAFSADGLPLVGRLPGTDRCYVAGAYTGHGNAYAISAARVVSHLLRGEPAPDADLFDPARMLPTGE